MLPACSRTHYAIDIAAAVIWTVGRRYAVQTVRKLPGGLPLFALAGWWLKEGHTYPAVLAAPAANAAGGRRRSSRWAQLAAVEDAGEPQAPVGSADHELEGAAVPKPHARALELVRAGRVVEQLQADQLAVVDDVIPLPLVRSLLKELDGLRQGGALSETQQQVEGTPCCQPFICPAPAFGGQLAGMGNAQSQWAGAVGRSSMRPRATGQTAAHSRSCPDTLTGCARRRPTGCGRTRCGIPQHGLSSNKMDLITPDCGTMCSPVIKWP